jgi:O2-independent ubiquinone biosynthesis protein UbiV
MSPRPIELVLGPLLFNWAPGRVRDFYARMADEAPIDRAYLGEVVCGKRAPLLGGALADSAERLERGGKAVVWSAPALPATPRERRAAHDLIAAGALVELNDVSGLAYLRPGGRFVAGPFLNVYNEAAAGELAKRGCVRMCANVELPLSSIATIARASPALEIEVFGFGRLPLALSGRCYHARENGLHRDSCQFVCDRDPDGLAVRTLEGEAFLAVNGVQILSHGVQLANAPPDVLREAGVSALRLSPHTADMVGVTSAFRRFLDERIDARELAAAVEATGPAGPLVNGYLSGRAGLTLVSAP